MALDKDDPWYVPLPDSRSDQPGNRRYQRALALSRFRREIEQYNRQPGLQSADSIAYRRHCLAHWQDYLDGRIDPPTGRKVKDA